MPAEDRLSLQQRIEELANPFLQEMGAEIVDLSIHQAGNQMTLQILADKPQGGISLGECSYLNQRINRAIEAANLITCYYLVEVSSPGLDRPLRTSKDFLRNLGKDVHFFLSGPVADRIEHSGVVTAVEPGGVVIESKGIELVIPLDKINKAKQVV